MIPKYRAWHKEQKIMLGVGGIHWTILHEQEVNEVVVYFPEKAQEIFKESGSYPPLWYAVSELKPKHFGHVNDLILMLCTGLKDKHGVEIFEGDIVKSGEFVYIVIWYDKRGGFRLDKQNAYVWEEKQDSKYHKHKLFHNPKLIEVIGNVHSNPELLKNKT